MEKGSATCELEGDTSTFNKTPGVAKVDKVEIGRTKDLTINLNEIIFSNLTEKATCKITYTFTLGDETIQFYIIINLIR